MNLLRVLGTPKPRIRYRCFTTQWEGRSRLVVGWFCEGAGLRAKGHTPVEAFNRWQKKVATWPFDAAMAECHQGRRPYSDLDCRYSFYYEPARRPSWWACLFNRPRNPE